MEQQRRRPLKLPIPTTILTGALGVGKTTAVCHLGNISYRTAEERPFEGAESIFKDNPVLAEAYGRMTEHLTKSNVDLKSEKIRIGNALEFDPKTETFPGDAKATALLRREYRAPFTVPEKV